jgi:hypothetical protein
LARYIAALTPILFLVACVPMGPRDGLVVITGIAPSESSWCEVEVAAVGSKSEPQWRRVSGAFRESFVISPNRRGHRAALECGGKLVAERTFKYGRDIEIGGEIALDRPAP